MALPFIVPALSLFGRGVSAFGRLARGARRIDFDGGQGVGIRLQVRTEGFKETIRDLERLRRDLVEKAMATAINRTLERGRTFAVRTVRETYNVKAGAVRDVLRIKRASAAGSQLRI